MRNRQSRVLDTVHAVQRFLDDHADVVGSSITSSRRNLDAVDAELTSFALTQAHDTGSMLGETNRQRALRASLRSNHMRPIAEVARQMLREAPEFSTFQMPPANATSTQLATFAFAMADAAAPHEQVFKDVGLPDDFIASLRSAASELAASVVDRSQQSGRRVGATEGLAKKEKHAASTIRLIDAIVRPKLGVNDALLRAWQVAKRVLRKGVSSADAATPQPGSTGGSATTEPATPPATQPATSATSATPSAPAA